MWWFYYDKNSAITVVALYLPIKKCKENHCMESIYIYILNNKKAFPISITIPYNYRSINLPCDI